jgi:hypothetical protein
MLKQELIIPKIKKAVAKTLDSSGDFVPIGFL